MPVPLLDDASPVNDTFGALVSSALLKTVPRTAGSNADVVFDLRPSAVVRVESPQPALGGEQLRALAMPTSQEIVSARRKLHAKAALIASALFGAFTALIAPFTPLLLRPVAFVVVVISLIMVATSIMHDANHGAFFAKSERANNTVGYLADLLGVSSLLWRIKHNIHHADTNVQGIDADIDQGVIARLAALWPHGCAVARAF
jgi:fatty acid desaturase